MITSENGFDMEKWKNNKAFSRRSFISGVLSKAAMAGAILPLAVACGKAKEESAEESNTPATPANCRDLTGVSEQDLAVRKKLAYVNESPIPDNECNNCNLYLPPTGEKKCGGCMLFKGPVEAKGYCTYWAPKIDS